MTAGWRATATLGEHSRTLQRTVDGSIARSARFVYTTAVQADVVATLAARLADSVWRAPVGAPLTLEQAETRPAESPRWSCVARYPTASFVCAWCESAQLLWLDGDGSVYGAEASCAACGARTRFEDATTT